MQHLTETGQDVCLSGLFEIMCSVKFVRYKSCPSHTGNLLHLVDLDGLFAVTMATDKSLAE